jgi:hypothetical protein
MNAEYFETVKNGPNAGQLVRLECTKYAIIERPMAHHKDGLSYTATGYGAKIPTRYMVRTIDQKWRRVYCRIYSNIGTLYVMHGKDRTIVNLLGLY